LWCDSIVPAAGVALEFRNAGVVAIMQSLGLPLAGSLQAFDVPAKVAAPAAGGHMDG
jgi:hypothetical protein